MSSVFSAIGKVAGIIAMIPSPIQPIAAAVAVTSTVLAAVTARKPAPQGSSTDITIGANMGADCLIGETYSGGNRVTQVGYGEEDDVPNAHLWVVDVFSVAGPLHALVSSQADFTEITFSDGDNADGYYHNNLHRYYQLGATPESAALMPHPPWGAAPDWGSTYKLSGKAAIGWSARWAKKDNVFTSGFPQTGAVWQGILVYDPRLDSTYPGGAGSHRWADPTDKAAFSAAKPTWTYSRNPGLHALRYALGSWERDETNTSAPYQRVFGIGGTWDQVIVEDFVALANVCDANGWTVNGRLTEGPGASKWDNLIRICAAGGAEPVFKGGRLGVAIRAPKITLDTITRDDIADGDIIVPACLTWTGRKNTLIPKFIDPNSRWASVPTTVPVQVADYVAADGEVKTEEFTLDLVTNATQAAQLAGYELVSRREQQGIVLPLKPRFRRYRPDQKLMLSADLQAELGIQQAEVVITGVDRDPANMRWNFTFRVEDPDKHLYALGLTGTAPPSPSNPTPEDYDNAGGVPAAYSATGLNVFAEGDGTVSYSYTNPTTAALDHASLMVNSSADLSTATDTLETLDATSGGGVAGSMTGVSLGVAYYWVLFYNASGVLLSTAGPVGINVT
jgi:hypothetical protein